MANLDALDRLTRGPLRPRGADARVRAGNELASVRPTLRSASPRRPAAERAEAPSRSLARMPSSTGSINPRPPLVIVRERVVDRPARGERPASPEPRPEPRWIVRDKPVGVAVRAGERPSAHTIERVERLRTVERIERIEKVEKVEKVERVSAGQSRRRAVPAPVRGSRPRVPTPVSRSTLPRALEPTLRGPTPPKRTRMRAPLRSGASSPSVERRPGRARGMATSPTVPPANARALGEARRVANEAPVVRVEARKHERVRSGEPERRPTETIERRPAPRPSKQARPEANTSAPPRPRTTAEPDPKAAAPRREQPPNPVARPAAHPQPARPTPTRRSSSKPAPRQLGVRISIAHVEIRTQPRERKPSRTIAAAGPRAHSITPRLIGAV